jgi:hypothetical protein
MGAWLVKHMKGRYPRQAFLKTYWIRGVQVFFIPAISTKIRAEGVRMKTCFPRPMSHLALVAPEAMKKSVKEPKFVFAETCLRESNFCCATDLWAQTKNVPGACFRALEVWARLRCVLTGMAPPAMQIIKETGVRTTKEKKRLRVRVQSASKKKVGAAETIIKGMLRSWHGKVTLQFLLRVRKGTPSSREQTACYT